MLNSVPRRLRCFALLVFAAAFIELVGAQSVAPTYAWRHTIPGGANAIVAGGMDVDIHGYAYTLYLQGGTTARLMKLGPANSLMFDVSAATFTSASFTPYRAIVTPFINGQQYVYAIGQSADTANVVSTIWVKKFNTSGAPVWAGDVTLSALNGNTPVGAFVKSNGDLLVAGQSVTRGGSYELAMYDVDSASGTFTQQVANDISPIVAYYDSNTDSWFASGQSSQSPTTAAWGSYSASTGTKNFGGQVAASYDPDSTIDTTYDFYIGALPNGHVAVAQNAYHNNQTTGETTSDFQLNVIDTLNHPTFSYPPSGTPTTGNVMQVVSLDASSPIYVIGNESTTVSGHPYSYLSKYTWTGTQIFKTDQKPVGTLFPTSDGFFDLFDWGDSSSTFLEHYVDATSTFNWGKQYSWNLAKDDYSYALKQFQNSAYLVHANGNDVAIDRFVMGTCLSKISCPATFVGGNPLSVTIQLNAPAPTGGAVVALNSSSANALMPNGTRAQNFLVPAGQSFLVVALSTVPTGGTSCGVTLLAIQNGIRRNAAATGQPGGIE